MAEFSGTFYSLKRFALASSAIWLFLILSQPLVFDNLSDSPATITILGIELKYVVLDYLIWGLFIASLYYSGSFILTAFIERTKILNEVASRNTDLIDTINNGIGKIVSDLPEERERGSERIGHLIETINRAENELKAALGRVALVVEQNSAAITDDEQKRRINSALLDTVADGIARGTQFKDAINNARSYKAVTGAIGDGNRIPAVLASDLFEKLQSYLGEFERQTRINMLAEASSQTSKMLVEQKNNLSTLKLEIERLCSQLQADRQRFEEAVGENAVNKLTKALSEAMTAIGVRFWALDVGAPLVLSVFSLLHFIGLYWPLFPSVTEFIPTIPK